MKKYIKDSNKTEVIFDLLEELKALPEGKEYVLEIRKVKDIRTERQRNAMELYFRNVAKDLEDAGITRKQVLDFLTSELPWSRESVKELIWRRMQEAIGFGTETHKLPIDKVSTVYEVCNRFLSEKFGIYTPFPCIEQVEHEENCLTR